MDLRGVDTCAVESYHVLHLLFSVDELILVKSCRQVG